jgi:tRNA nucleotidyltransferase (CCA-adding enzyme)
MQIYLVGGAIRDELLGLGGYDRDWVVVGATPEELVAQGYEPVGKDFPVFLHPKTKEEYALARTERKTAPGYRGFVIHASPEVTLEEDLARRDLTINAMACLPEDSLSKENIIDPYGGQQDLENKLLRHVTDAFREDPVRILRLARFAARFPEFKVAPETMQLMREMVADGEIDALVSERVWQELSRGLMGARPSRMLQVLRECGALAKLLPEVNALYGVPQRAEYHPEIDTGIHLEMVLDQSALMGAPLAVRFACLCHDLGKGTTPADVLPRHIGHEQRSVKLTLALCERWRVPVECKELAEVVAREHGNIHQSDEFSASAVLRLLTRCDALRRSERFEHILQACVCDAKGRLGKANEPYPQGERLSQCLKAALQVDTAKISQIAIQQGMKGAQIGALIDSAREKEIAAYLSNFKN